MTDAASSRPRLSAAGRRQQLLDVTRALVVESSFHEVTIDAIARRAGVSRPVVYSHFNDLEELLAALIEREGGRALAGLNRFLPSPAPGRPARELLLEGLGGYLEAVRSDPALWRLVLMPPEGAPEELRERIAAARARVIGALAGLVDGELGLGASPDSELTARLLSVFADECARLVLTDPAEYPTSRLLAFAAWALDCLTAPK